MFFLRHSIDNLICIRSNNEQPITTAPKLPNQWKKYEYDRLEITQAPWRKVLLLFCIRDTTIRTNRSHRWRRRWRRQRRKETRRIQRSANGEQCKRAFTFHLPFYRLFMYFISYNFFSVWCVYSTTLPLKFNCMCPHTLTWAMRTLLKYNFTHASRTSHTRCRQYRMHIHTIHIRHNCYESGWMQYTIFSTHRHFSHFDIRVFSILSRMKLSSLILESFPIVWTLYNKPTINWKRRALNICRRSPTI